MSNPGLLEITEWEPWSEAVITRFSWQNV